jgi:GT2 family glycosyltransferase
LNLERRTLNSSPPVVSVVVVTWNGLRHLQTCLPAVLEQRLDSGDTLELIVVDNASADGSREYLAKLAGADARIKVLLNPRNEGFSGPNNDAFKHARGEFIATLNNDAPPEPGWLAALLAVARADARIGSVASRMVFAHAPNVIQSAGIAIDRAAIAWDRLVGEPVSADGHAVTQVFGASAGAALYRAEMLHQLGGFDARFFMYLEDVDLAWRARIAGWKAVYAPDAVVRHAHSASAGEGSPFKLWHLGRNKWWTVARCYPPEGLRRFLPAVLAYDLASLPVTVSRLRTTAPITGRLAALRGLAPFIQDRRAFHAEHPNGWALTQEWMEPLKSPLKVLNRYRRLGQVVSGSKAST